MGQCPLKLPASEQYFQCALCQRQTIVAKIHVAVVDKHSAGAVATALNQFFSVGSQLVFVLGFGGCCQEDRKNKSPFVLEGKVLDGEVKRR